MKIIPYSRQSINTDDIKEMVKVLKSDWLTQGPKIKEFEQALCRYAGVKYAVALSSGTAALHLSMIALNIGKDDKIITSPITFSASANCALYVGAAPQFIDIDDKTYHLDIEKLRRFLKVPSQRKKIKAIVAVHFMGTVIDIEKIRKICDKYGIKVIEDAAHAMGAKYRYKGRWIRVGNCKHSDVTIFSFHPIKHITTGEGGALLTNNKEIYERVLKLRHHGIIKNKTKPEWFYDILEIGFNYRITDFQCAMGLSQLKKLNVMVEKRRKFVATYNQYFSEIKEVKLPYERVNTQASYHLYVIRVVENARDKLYSYLKENGILAQINYIPTHLFSYYKKNFGYTSGDFPIAEKYFRECLSLPLYAGLSKANQLKVIKTVMRFLKEKNIK